MKLHVIFIVLHILAVLVTLGIGLVITIPVHIILAIKQTKKKAAETYKTTLDTLSDTPKDEGV